MDARVIPATDFGFSGKPAPKPPGNPGSVPKGGACAQRWRALAEGARERTAQRWHTLPESAPKMNRIKVARSRRERTRMNRRITDREAPLHSLPSPASPAVPRHLHSPPHSPPKIPKFPRFPLCFLEILSISKPSNPPFLTIPRLAHTPICFPTHSKPMPSTTLQQPAPPRTQPTEKKWGFSKIFLATRGFRGLNTPEAEVRPLHPCPISVGPRPL